MLEGLTVPYAFEQLSNFKNTYKACSLRNILVGELSQFSMLGITVCSAITDDRKPGFLLDCSLVWH